MASSTISSRSSRPPLVLVVDDDPNIVAAFTEILEFEGHAAVPAHTAEAALRLIHSGIRPDAILLDLRMPGIGGLGFLLALRAQPGCDGIAVAVVTADSYLDNTTQQAVQALGATLSYKPMSIDQIVALSRQMLSAAALAPRVAEPGA